MKPNIDTRPPLPKYLLFSAKKLVARAVPLTIQLGGKNGDQIAMDFLIAPEQRGVVYSAPEELKLDEGDYVEIPKGTTVRMYASFAGGAAEYTVDKLRAAGWTGKSIAALDKELKARSGNYFGIGDVDCTITVNVKDTTVDNDGNEVWKMAGEGDKRRFAPIMEVGFVNRLGGAAFKDEASAGDLEDLDARLAGILSGDKRPRGAAASTTGKPSSATTGAGSQAPAIEPGEDDIPF